MEETRYFLDQDRDCHWYLVPARHTEEWEDWKNVPGTDDRSWYAPIFAERIDGPHVLTFTDPHWPS